MEKGELMMKKYLLLAKTDNVLFIAGFDGIFGWSRQRLVHTYLRLLAA